MPEHDTLYVISNWGCTMNAPVLYLCNLHYLEIYSKSKHWNALIVDICILICRYYIVNFDIKQLQSTVVSYYRCSCFDRAYSKVARREIKISVLKMCFPQRKDEFMHVLTWITHNCQDPKLETKPNRVMHGYVHIIDAQHHVIRKQ